AGTFHTPPCGRMSYPVLAPVSRGYPRVWGRLPTCYSPVRHSSTPPQGQSFSVRLACVKHAASVRPEPGSNSPTMPEFNPSKTNTHTTRHAHSLHSKKPPTLPNPTTGPESIRATNTSQTNPLLSSQRTHRKSSAIPAHCSFSRGTLTTLAAPFSASHRGVIPRPGHRNRPPQQPLTPATLEHHGKIQFLKPHPENPTTRWYFRKPPPGPKLISSFRPAPRWHKTIYTPTEHRRTPPPTKQQNTRSTGVKPPVEASEPYLVNSLRSCPRSGGS